MPSMGTPDLPSGTGLELDEIIEVLPGPLLVIFDQFEEYFQYHPSDGSKQITSVKSSPTSYT